MAYELIKVSELPELTTPADANVLPIQDGDYLKRISFANLKDAAVGDTEGSLAAAYDSTATYAVGDYCIYEGQLYRCTTAITTAEAWTAGHWTVAVLTDDIASDLSAEASTRSTNDNALAADIAEALGDLAAVYSSSATYAVGDYCTKDGQLYRCTTAITTAEAWTAAHWSAVALGNDTRDLKSALNTIGVADETVDFTEYNVINGTMQANGQWGGYTGDTYQSTLVTDIAYSIKVTAQNAHNAYISFFNKVPTQPAGEAQQIYFCNGETGRHTVNAGTSEDFEVPSDCKCIVVTTKSNGVDYTPQISERFKTDGLITDLNNDKADVIVNTASGAIANFTDGAAMPVKGLTVNIDPVQSGSGDPSPTNVRPITGWDAVKVTRTGKNLFNVDDVAEISVGSINRIGVYFKKSGTYTVSAQASGNYMYCRVFNADRTTKATYYIVSSTTITNATFTISDGEYFAVYYATETTINVAKQAFNTWKPQVELSSIATSYEPYNGQSVTIQLGQTVYGGMLDVLTGVLTVDKAIAEFDGSEDESWTRANNYQGFYHYQDTMKAGTRQDGTANWLKIVYGLNQRGIWLGVNNKMIYVNYIDDLLTESTAEGWRAYLASNPLQIVYPLATPLTIQLTAEQLSTIKGINNIFADTGDVTVQYGADTKLYIEDSIVAPSFSMIAPIENCTTASQAYTTGQYFLHNNVFCKAKTNIASGATFTLGTNYLETTVAAELYAALH